MGVRGAGVRALCAGIVVWLVAGGAAGVASAQSPAQEVWPEVDVWLRFSPAWRASFFVPVSENLETHYREGNLILQADYAWGQTKRNARLIDENRVQVMKAWLIRGGYLGGRSLDDEGAEYTEYAALVEWHVRLPLKGGVLMYDSRSSVAELFALGVILHIFFDASRAP